MSLETILLNADSEFSESNRALSFEKSDWPFEADPNRPEVLCFPQRVGLTNA